MATGRVDIVEQNPRGPRWVGTLVLVALLALPLIGILADRDTSRPVPIVTPVPLRNAISVTPNAVYPAATGQGDTRTMRVAFPDGSRAAITYPTDLNLSSLGVRPHVSGTLGGDGKEGEFRSLTAPLYGEAETASGRPMIRRLTGNVTVWPGPLGVDTAGSVLLFAFGDWRIALQDTSAGMTFEQRVAWAENLHGRLTPDGFLTLSADGPVRLSRPGQTREGVLVGPQLWLGGLSRRMLVLAPIPGCERASKTRVVLDSRHPVAGSVCRGGFYLAASGDEDFVRSALKDVRVRPQ
ncbi:hypothetical protein GCM10023194_43300 [Planotetraspora phitsanulokensis]|uniref:Uncharacterized protein n=1 Tax=Planotetraspora phitsanulokensis TaxID=575192 RepID=A0A8J3U6I5_9ACTN|nr:hypothetical protein [Planotetraspora phitsanulokensis]GII37932.1 hypothetical protein Pph01_29350 [Planotetraspora phitsanulokensis]